MDTKWAVQANHVSKNFIIPWKETVHALQDVSFTVERGAITGLIGPDGAGKTTLMRLLAGLMDVTSGELDVLGLSVNKESEKVQALLSYMPQKFGLYEDLSVQENMNLYADLHGIPQTIRKERFTRLLEMTGLTAFTGRQAGRLSGGMKQKLGLACTLVRSPKLLLLDEPTVGVDPFSRQELWAILHQLIKSDDLAVFVSTAYMDEAAQCKEVYVLNKGRFLAHGTPDELTQLSQGRCYQVRVPKGLLMRDVQAAIIDDSDYVVDAVPEGGAVRYVKNKRNQPIPWLAQYQMEEKPIASRLEDTFMMLLKEDELARKQDSSLLEDRRVTQAALLSEKQSSLVENKEELGIDKDTIVARQQAILTKEDIRNRLLSPHFEEREERPIEVSVSHLIRRFGDFTAVSNTSFTVQKGEVFGLLGPNGAGKTTTFRMLCGLLPVTSGDLMVGGVDVVKSRTKARTNFGYVAQKFSLYGTLSVRENLNFFGGVYGLSDKRKEERIEAMLDEFKLHDVIDMAAGELPGGYKQRLSMAAALLHQPRILFLDEPTSGIDPLTRRNFWRQITKLSKMGTTIIITTHFMEEAEYCDRIMIQDAGKLIAIGKPDDLRKQSKSGAINMNDVFIEIVLDGRKAKEAAI